MLTRLKVSSAYFTKFDQEEALEAIEIECLKEKSPFLINLYSLFNPEQKKQFYVYLMKEHSRLGPGSSFGELAL